MGAREQQKAKLIFRDCKRHGFPCMSHPCLLDCNIIVEGEIFLPRPEQEMASTTVKALFFQFLDVVTVQQNQN
jgi:hypothetical protein